MRKLMRKVMYGYRRIRYLLRGIGVQVESKTVIFETFSGKGYSDSPRAVYEFMKQDERYAEYTFLWIFKEPEEYNWLEDDRTKLVKYQSKACEKALQKAKYWIFNYRALDHWVPTKRQVYVQCWHGVPLKRLGYDIQSSNNAMNSLSEIRDKYRWDTKRFKYLLSSCPFSSEKFRSAWNLKAFHKEKAILEVGYPRNDFLVNHTEDDVVQIKDKLDLTEAVAAGKKIILYAPTWRDNQHDASQGYTYDVNVDFKIWQKQLGDDYIILFRAHYLVANSFDFAAYDGFVRDVSGVDDINELYVVSDMLITDYSSVFFDYAILNRPILFYMYDLEQYRDEMRGFYLGLEELPGQIVQDEENVLAEILKLCSADVGSNPVVQHDEFNRRFNYLNDGKASERIVEKVVKDIPSKLIVANVFKHCKVKDEKLYLSAFCFVKATKQKYRDFDFRKVQATVGDCLIQMNGCYKHGILFFKGWHLNKYCLKLELQMTSSMDIQNKINILYGDVKGRILYNVFDLKKGNGRVSRVFEYHSNGVYFRQSIKNTLYLTVRESNQYDCRSGQRKIEKAFILSKIYRKKNFILLYEKECQKYEESAAVLYEKLVDEGYANCYYILNSDNPVLKYLDEKYKKNIIYKDSFKHILYFFMCKTFIGTETLGHAMQLRIANRHVIKKTQSKELNYVFLQHGVMYMISLNSEMRVGFRDSNHNLYRVVVSSQLEANHFLELGGFHKENLYVTGLAKFDRSSRYPDADRIVIMPTWRRWESNLAYEHFELTKYYQMMQRIVAAIPAEHQDKIIILPHPLMRSAMEQSCSVLNQYLPDQSSYDEILKNCELLITDYSSIAYDAFYRGSKVIFYWEEKDECLEHYGQNACLMLNKENVFGDICWNAEEVKQCFNRNYFEAQKREYIEKYRKIVEFHDERNTERIISQLKKDQII